MESLVATLFRDLHQFHDEHDQIWVAALSLATLNHPIRSSSISPQSSANDSITSLSESSPAKDIPLFTPWSRSRSRTNVYQRSLHSGRLSSSFRLPESYPSSPESSLHRWVLTHNHLERQRRQYRHSQEWAQSGPQATRALSSSPPSQSLDEGYFIDDGAEDEEREKMNIDWDLGDALQKTPSHGMSRSSPHRFSKLIS